MPNFSNEEIQALVDDGEISAVTLDTTVFDQFGCNLQYATLAALKQFSGTDVRVVLSRVTLGEVTAHINRDLLAATEKVRAAVNQYLKVLRQSERMIEVVQKLDLDRNVGDYAARAVENFVKSLGAVQVAAGPDVSTEELLDLYFKSEPPFSSKSMKKHEFPDAIALLSLESWAARNGGFLLAVSRDGDWERYAEKSKRIICVKDLKAGLNFFHTESSIVAARIKGQIMQGETPSFSQQIRQELDDYIAEFQVYAESHFMVEEEPESSRILRWAVSPDASFDVLDSDNSTVNIAFDLEVEAEFTANFDFSVRDSIDRDYVSMGSTTVSRTEVLTVSIVVRFPRAAGEDPEPWNIDLESRPPSIDFGYVEPVWDYDD